MTDTDRLPTPTDMVDLLKGLTAILRDIETLPDTAQQRFWADTQHELDATPVEDLCFADGIGTRSCTVLHNLLASMYGAKFREVATSAVKEYYEQLIAQVKEVMGDCAWGPFLNRKFDETKGTDQ